MVITIFDDDDDEDDGGHHHHHHHGKGHGNLDNADCDMITETDGGDDNDDSLE